MATVNKNNILVVFDFDQTLLENNSDVEIQKLGPCGKIPDELYQVAKDEGWTAFVNVVLKYLHKQGVTPDQIKTFIRNLPYVQGAIGMIHQLKNEFNADIIIISDANSVYINESLDNADLKDAFFEEIYTNPAEFLTSGQLVVTPFSHQTQCDLSERNLCKGKVMLDFIGDKNYSFVSYVGDGGNDFCAIHKLTENDLAFVRKGYALEKKIPNMKEKKGLVVKAAVYLWDKPSEIVAAIQTKLDSINWFLFKKMLISKKKRFFFT